MPKIPLYLPFKEGPTIRIEYKDQIVSGSNSFNTIKELVMFLNDNPDVAKAIGYVPKNQEYVGR